MADLADSAGAAARLVAHVRDPARERPVVCVTVPTWASEPLVDVGTLEETLEGTADVWVVPTGEASWELTARLPPGLDVYGGAVRIWWPGLDDGADRYAHPLIFAYAPSDSPAVIEQVVTLLEQHGTLAGLRPEPGSEHPATVTRVLHSGAELQLAGGALAFAHRRHLSRHHLHPDQVVRVGQAVRVRVSEPDPTRRRVPVSLLPFEPDPWDRVFDEYEVGSLIECEVTELRNIGALVALLPGGATGLVHVSKLSEEWVSHPEELLAVGDRVRARIERLDRQDRKVWLTLRGVPADARPAPAAIYPDGPPWLPPLPEPPEPEPEPEPEPPPEPVRAATPPPQIEAAPAAGLEPEDAPGPEPDLVPATAAEPAGDSVPAAAAPDELDQLEQAVAQAKDVQREVRELLDGRQQQLARLRAEAAQIRRTLERDLADVRRRILEVLESETHQLVGSTQEALETARREAAEWREQLAAADQDRQHLLKRLREEADRAEQAERTAREARQQLSRERVATQTLRTQLRRMAPDEEALLRDEMRAAWLESTTPQDRERYPWRELVVGPEFAGSLRRVEGVSRERVVAVCAEVVCGRAPERPGLEVHPLRASDGGGTAQRVRADGAKAYRASLQVSTPAARRLHYWELPDGGVELAKIVYHDDFTIR